MNRFIQPGQKTKESLMIRRVLLALTTAALVAVATIGLASPAQAVVHAVGTYYINNSGSPSCSNANTGTNQSQPWCDFTNVNGHTFQAGSSILLSAGEIWTDGVAPLGSGSASSPITLGCYGFSCDSNYPTIRPDSSAVDGVYLSDPSNWVVSNLSITAARNGIRSNFTTTGHTNLSFANLYIYDVAANGMLFDGFNSNPQPSLPTTSWVIKGVSVDNVGIFNPGLNGVDLIVTYPLVQMLDAGLPHAQQDLLFRNMKIEGAEGGAINGPNTSNGKFINIWQRNNNNAGLGGSAHYWTSTSNIDWINNVDLNTPFTNPYDNAAYVFDNHVVNMRWHGLVARDNSASAIEVADTYCVIDCTSSTNTGSVIESSTFANNSTANVCYVPGGGPFGYYGDIDLTLGAHTEMSVQDNIYFLRTQSCNAFIHGSSANLSQSNNVQIGSDANLYSSVLGFSGTQGANNWTYVSNGATDAGAFSNMTYANERWTDGSGGSISSFGLTPPTNPLDWVAKVWTAPRSGTVLIRGWIAKDTLGGDGAYAAISTGAAWLWHSSIGANDNSGMATNVSNVSVNAGDKLWFLVNSGGWAGGSTTSTDDTLSWIPTVAYTD